jgi:hypothetical protein
LAAGCHCSRPFSVFGQPRSTRAVARNFFHAGSFDYEGYGTLNAENRAKHDHNEADPHRRRRCHVCQHSSLRAEPAQLRTERSVWRHVRSAHKRLCAGSRRYAAVRGDARPLPALRMATPSLLICRAGLRRSQTRFDRLRVRAPCPLYPQSRHQSRHDHRSLKCQQHTFGSQRARACPDRRAKSVQSRADQSLATTGRAQSKR